MVAVHEISGEMIEIKRTEIISIFPIHSPTDPDYDHKTTYLAPIDPVKSIISHPLPSPVE